MSWQTLEEFRNYWLDAGPIRFAEEYLIPQPDFPSLSNIHVVLSPEQKAFLDDFIKGTKKMLVCGARGSGKTFVLAILILWLLVVFPYYKVNFMGGSTEQSELCQDYCDYWRDELIEIKQIVKKSVRGLKPKIKTIWGSICAFKACSQASARGSHVPLLILDEACTAESRSVDSRKAVKASYWQCTGKKDARLIITSTANFALGDFYKFLTNPKLYGFLIHKWSIARHKSGKPNLAVFSDKNPQNWTNNLWYIEESQIQDLRRRSSDSEWLVEALGEVSLSAGFVFKRFDIECMICPFSKECEECKPYEFGHCKLIEEFKLGRNLEQITDRRAGFDYGATAPCALTIAGRRGNLIFVLYNDEVKGLRTSEIMNWLNENCSKWKAFTIVPDPSVHGQAIAESLGDLGFAVWTIDPLGKEERIYGLRALIERHLVIVPPIYTYLIESMKQASYIEGGNKIRKLNDHSLDTMQYVCVDWTPQGLPRTGIQKGVRIWQN